MISSLQVEFITSGLVPSDLSTALVVNRAELQRLQQRIMQLEVENRQQKELCAKTRQQHERILIEISEMKVEITGKIHTGL